MTRLALRLALAGGREAAVRLVLTVIGVALGTTLLLSAAAADPAIRAHQQRQAWQHTGEDEADRTGTGDPLLWRLTSDGVDGRTIGVLRVAATGPRAPVPLGLDHVPRAGEAFVSESLAELIASLPPDRLANRFGGAPAGTIDDRFVEGPDHLLAVVGMPVETLRDQSGVLEVHRIRTAAVAFDFTDALRMILPLGAVALLLPMVVFVATSTRLGAARRELRFAAMRLAGATPRQAGAFAAVEGAIAAAVGAVLGCAGLVAVRPLLARVAIDGHRSFPSDVRVAPALAVASLVAIPLLAALTAMASLRRLRISPLGVTRRAARPRPTPWRLLPIVAGGLGFVLSLGTATRSDSDMVLLLVVGSFAVKALGIVVAGPWLTVLAARALGRGRAGATALLAARRLEDDPAGAFRAVSGLVLAVFMASVLSGVTPAIIADNRSGDGLLRADVLAVAAPADTSSEHGQQAIELARAQGATAGVLLHAGPGPNDGERLLAACRDLVALGTSGPCAGETAWVAPGETRPEPAPYSTEELATMPVREILLATDGSPVTTDRVRTAMAEALPGSEAVLGSEQDARGNARLVELNRMTNLALAITLLVAGCSLAVAVAGGIVERRRPFGLLRLAGMQLSELRRVALLEAAAPLLVIATVTALLGLAASIVIVDEMGTATWQLPGPGYWVGLAGGLAGALGVSAATLPLLGPATAPTAVRFE